MDKDYKGQGVTFALGERDNDNYFALVWNDPNSMEIRNTKEMLRFFDDIRADNEGEWCKFCDVFDGDFTSSKPSEIVDHLTSDLRNIVSEWDGFLSIRAIARKY